MLITEILLQHRESDHAARIFYMRRLLRIMPLYLVTLIFTFGILPWFLRAEDTAFASMRSVQGWYWVHCANVEAPFLHLKRNFDYGHNGADQLYQGERLTSCGASDVAFATLSALQASPATNNVRTERGAR